MKKRLLIGVIITECNVDFQAEILNGLISQAFKADCNIAVLAPLHNFYSHTPHKQTEKEIFKLILSDSFDGFLYDRNTFYNDEIKSYIENYLIRSGKPVMLMDQSEHKIFESTAIDDCLAFEQITDHLIEIHGCKRIYCLTGPRNIFVSEERLKGYQTSMKKHNLPYDKSCCIYGDFWTGAAEALAARIINSEIARPDAVVCGNDYSAIALISALSRGGIKVPEDIAVTGYDASSEGQQNVPKITSYRRPNFQLGVEAFRRIYRIITGKICKRVHRGTSGTGNFRIGQSCGCVVQEPPHQVTTRAERIPGRHLPGLRAARTGGGGDFYPLFRIR